MVMNCVMLDHYDDAVNIKCSSTERTSNVEENVIVNLQIITKIFFKFWNCFLRLGKKCESFWISCYITSCENQNEEEWDVENRTHYLHLFRFCYCECCVVASMPFRITAYFRRTDRGREKKISCCCSTKSTNNWTKKIWNSLEEQNFAFSAILVAVTFSFPAWIDELTTEPTYSKCISYSNNNCYYRYCLKILLATVFLAFLSAHQWIRMFFFSVVYVAVG